MNKSFCHNSTVPFKTWQTHPFTAATRGFHPVLLGKPWTTSQSVLKEGWIDALLQELLQGSSWVKGLLIKHFPSKPMSKEALSSSFYAYNLHFPWHFPQAFLSRQAVWSLHHPWAQWQCCLSACKEEREMPARGVPPPLDRDDNRREARGLQGMLTPHNLHLLPFSGIPG